MKKINAIIFIVFIFGFAIFGLTSKDTQYSSSERRNLATFKPATVENVMSGDFFKSFTKYATEQFPLRESFRAINAQTRKNLFAQQDVNGIYTSQDYIFKRDYPINDKTIDNFIKKTNEVYNTYIKGKAENYYVSVIPDKSYFDGIDVLTNDAKTVADKFTSGLEGAEYIDIFDSLSLSSYYKTDSHWSQDKLFPVINTFAKQMNFPLLLEENYEKNILNGFCGVYYGQSALPFESENLIYMSNEVTDKAELFNLETNSYTQIYNLDNFDSEDPYNVFSDGAAALIKIESPFARTDKELVVFRDSFGSSIAPLFLEEYSKVTLVDLRYFASSLLSKEVNFENADVLVLYSSLILNSDIILK